METLAITCVICKKTQRGWIQDYPLCDSKPNLRICSNCHEKLNRLTSSKTPEKESEVIDFFQNSVDADSLDNDVKKFLSGVLGEANKLRDENRAKEIEKQLSEKAKEKATLELEKRFSELLLTTGQSFEGFKIIKYIDVVCEESVFKNSFSKRLDANLEDIANSLSLKDTEMSGAKSLITNAREYTMDQFKKKAVALGANAILGIQFQSSWGRDVVRVSIAGTAVIIQENNL